MPKGGSTLIVILSGGWKTCTRTKSVGRDLFPATLYIYIKVIGMDVAGVRERNSGRENKFYSPHKGYLCSQHRGRDFPIKGEVPVHSVNLNPFKPFLPLNVLSHRFSPLDVRSSAVHNKRHRQCGFRCTHDFFSLPLPIRTLLTCVILFNENFTQNMCA